MQKSKNILIVAGEASGDLHASSLVNAIKEKRPEITFFGLGGEKLKKSGINIIFDITELAVVGIFEVLKNLRKFREIFSLLLEETGRQKPNLAILVDYPGFNLRLAKELKKRGIPVIYYISPQIWAWGKNRIKTIRELVDLMLVVFKFEEGLYKENKQRVVFVGHPLLDIVKPKISKAELFSQTGLDAKNITIALLPGSREREVKNLLPVMLDTACLLQKKAGMSLQFLILRATSVKEEVFDEILRKYTLPAKVLSDMTYEGLNSSDFAMVCSGTATLETAILGVPMVILYKVSFLTWAYMKMLIKIPYIGLVNVVKKEKFIAEFIQYDAQPKRIADYVGRLLEDKEGLKKIKQGLIGIPEQLGEKGASHKAAQEVLKFLQLG